MTRKRKTAKLVELVTASRDAHDVWWRAHEACAQYGRSAGIVGKPDDERMAELREVECVAFRDAEAAHRIERDFRTENCLL